MVLGTFSLITLSKFVFEASNSVLALINFAFAPAKKTLIELNLLK